MADQTRERERERIEAPSGDPMIGKTEEAAVDEERARRAANLFDLRRLIGGIFLIYGAILTVLGIGASDAEIQKAAGVNLNLWVGLSLLAVGALFLVWAFTRPLGDELDDEEEEDEATTARTSRFERDQSETASGRSGRDQVSAGRDGGFRRE
jgi:hypothetical protein